MNYIPELVIFDDSRKDNAAELAREAAIKVGWMPDLYTVNAKAAAAIGFFTRAVITVPDVGPKHFFSGLSPYEVTDTLEIPRAVILNAGMDKERFLRDDLPDIALYRKDAENLEPRLIEWLGSLSRAA